MEAQAILGSLDTEGGDENPGYIMQGSAVAEDGLAGGIPADATNLAGVLDAGKVGHDGLLNDGGFGERRREYSW